MEEEKRPQGQAGQSPEGTTPRHEWDEPFQEGDFLTFQPPPPRAGGQAAPPPGPRKGKSPGKKKKTLRMKGLVGGPPKAPDPQQDPAPPGEAGPPTPQQLKSDRVVRLAQVRRRRNARRARALALITLALAVAIAWAVGAFGTSLAALADLADSIRIGLTPGDGFPVKTNISEIYQVEELSGGFVELGSQDLVLYSASGARLRSIQHNYSRPALAVGRTRFCVYARSGNELRVESRSQTLYTKATDDPLLLCAMSQNGSLAVVTRSSRYAAQLSVYSSAMEYRYGWNPSEKEGTPCRVAFSEDSKKLAVACLKAQDGRLTTGLYFLDTGKDSLLASSEETASLLLQIHWLDSSQLLAVFEDHAAVYNALTGAEKYRYDFGGEGLLSASASGKNTALLFSGGAGTAQDHLIVLDDRMQVLADAAIEGEASQVVCTRTAAYILEESSVQAYTLEGEEKWTVPTPAKPLALVDAKKLLLFTGVQADVLTAPAAGGQTAPVESGGEGAGSGPEGGASGDSSEPSSSAG